MEGLVHWWWEEGGSLVQKQQGTRRHPLPMGQDECGHSAHPHLLLTSFLFGGEGTEKGKIPSFVLFCFFKEDTYNCFEE